MVRSNPPVGLEDPFTGPPAASSLPRPTLTYPAAPMNALGRTQYSRLNSAKSRKSTGVEGKKASTNPASRITSLSDGLEDPFTGPSAGSMSSHQSATHPISQQFMGSFSQTYTSRLDSLSQQSTVEDNQAVPPFLRTPSPAAGMNGPFTGPPSASMSSQNSSSHPFTQQRMSAFNQVLVSHLKQPKTPQSSGADSNDASTHPPQLSRFTMRSNFPVSSIISARNRLAEQRSLPENLMDSRHLSIRSNGQQSSTPAALSASADPSRPASQQSGQQSMPAASQMAPSSNSVFPHQVTNTVSLNLAIHPAVQQNTATNNAIMANIVSSSSLFVAPVPAVHHLAVQPLPRPFLATFAPFTRLPTELQQEIWSIAIAVQYYKEKRFLRIAPDSGSLERTDDDSEDAQIRIISDIHRRPRLVPSLLHACHYSRKEAIKGYELWGCANPVTYEPNGAKVYVKVEIDSFFFGDAELGDFWALHTFINESTSDSASADDTARTKFIEQIGLIKHFTFDNELWNQLLEYEALWLANLDSCSQLTVAIRNPNHEQLDKDFALSFMKTIVPNTFREESARVILAVTRRALGASARDLRAMNWPENGNLELNVKSLSMGTSIGNTPEDETFLEDALIEGNRAGVVSDQYLEARLAMMNHRAPPPAPPAAPAPAPAPAPAAAAAAPVTAPNI
ncbi:hypothetical protein IFR05_002214 [Cadophora sp. M221]|nr:hypothetical protein IFR05_002214 [Cadophora sp. M221]